METQATTTMTITRTTMIMPMWEFRMKFAHLAGENIATVQDNQLTFKSPDESSPPDALTLGRLRKETAEISENAEVHLEGDSLSFRWGAPIRMTTGLYFRIK